MSGASIQRTLNAAFGTVGRVLGWPFIIYRPVDVVNPISDRNVVGAIKLSASPDEAFNKMPHGELDQFLLYTNASALELGDFLVSTELNRTYVVTDKAELRTAVGVLAQDRFNVLRPTMTAGSNTPRSFSEVASGVPGALKISGVSSSDGAMKVTSGTLGASSTQVEVWTWVPAGTVLLNDVLQIGSNRYLVTFVQSTAKGTKIKATSTKVGR